MRRARRGIGADDVVIEHSADRVALLLHPLQHALGAEQALFFARNAAKSSVAR